MTKREAAHVILTTVYAVSKVATDAFVPAMHVSALLQILFSALYVQAQLLIRCM